MGVREENLMLTNLVEIFRCSRNRTSLWLWQFFLDGSKHGYYVCPIICQKKTMPDLLIIPLLCAARNMDPNTTGAEVAAANVASHGGHPSSRGPFQFRVNHSLENHSLFSTQSDADWFLSSEIKYHLKLAHSHQCQSGRKLIWNIQQFLCWSKDLGFESEQEREQPTEAWISWINDLKSLL